MLNFWRFAQRFWQWFCHWALSGTRHKGVFSNNLTLRLPLIRFPRQGLVLGRTFLPTSTSVKHPEIHIFAPVVRPTEVCGQSSVEAALLLPILLFIVALLVQPLCLLYTRAHMESAAAEALRVNATNPNAAEVSAFVKRRLASIPNLGIFHEGGPDDWDITVEGSASKLGSVEITGYAKPLPVFYQFVSLAGLSDDKGIKLSVCCTAEMLPSWLEGDYAQWQEMWS